MNTLSAQSARIENIEQFIFSSHSGSVHHLGTQMGATVETEQIGEALTHQQQQQQQQQQQPLHQTALVAPHHAPLPAGASGSTASAGSITKTQLPPIRTVIRGVKSPTPHDEDCAQGSGPLAESRQKRQKKPPSINKPDLSDATIQRKYKLALLRLLSLDSFYPSDHSMLDVFRAGNDFPSDVVEIHSAYLLSWSRSWLRYIRNAVLRNTLDNSIQKSRHQLAIQLQQDMNATSDFTLDINIRKVALLRLLYFQWQSENRLGTKSTSMYRDYEARLKEVEALGPEEQKAKWISILDDEERWRQVFLQSAAAAVTSATSGGGGGGVVKGAADTPSSRSV
ncbi:hypothetical protein EV182_001402 [Spiromyces aspiralis]|uniref:Uncharacterized protein n=1 Tax=Spiromyces aspiralis TaxID=68401 RepID=A0ACC1HJ71_9FUNG|nr:hypothetical protein EV182_001402 [Spiromyces aspiralis]